jgi:hypothetical protein
VPNCSFFWGGCELGENASAEAMQGANKNTAPAHSACSFTEPIRYSGGAVGLSRRWVFLLKDDYNVMTAEIRRALKAQMTGWKHQKPSDTNANGQRCHATAGIHEDFEFCYLYNNATTKEKRDKRSRSRTSTNVSPLVNRFTSERGVSSKSGNTANYAYQSR